MATITPKSMIYPLSGGLPWRDFRKTRFSGKWPDVHHPPTLVSSKKSFPVKLFFLIFFLLKSSIISFISATLEHQRMSVELRAQLWIQYPPLAFFSNNRLQMLVWVFKPLCEFSKCLCEFSNPCVSFPNLWVSFQMLVWVFEILVWVFKSLCEFSKTMCEFSKTVREFVKWVFQNKQSRFLSPLYLSLPVPSLFRGIFRNNTIPEKVSDDELLKYQVQQFHLQKSS